MYLVNKMNYVVRHRVDSYGYDARRANSNLGYK